MSRHASAGGVGSCTSLSFPGVRGYNRHGASSAASAPKRATSKRVTAQPSKAPANHTASCPPASARSFPGSVKMLSYSSSASHRYPLSIATSALTLTSRSDAGGGCAGDLLRLSPNILDAALAADMRRSSGGAKRRSVTSLNMGAPVSVSRGVSSELSSSCATSVSR